MLTSRDLIKTFYRYAKIRFRLEGEDHELTAFKSNLSGAGSTGLFVPFRENHLDVAIRAGEKTYPH